MAKRGPRTRWHDAVRYQRRRNPKRLRAWQVAELHNAETFARWRRTPLNTFVTIRFDHVPRNGLREDKFFARIRDLAAKALTRRGIEYSGLYVFEAKGGIHVHWLLHCPAAIRPSFHQLLEIIVKQSDPRGLDMRVRRFGRDDRIMNYVTKGTDWMTARRRRGLARRQGRIEWKRCGTSQSIGKAARIKAGFETTNGSRNCAETSPRAGEAGECPRTDADARSQ